ncbi:uncharacterized protein I206_103256 [Kwoniella pini CBS 10737]|uniref:Uncharacterized protein n=1 Tax=Kwoniella pini CBS 10737 TaxID=1296096 RepID=A0A1B9IA34_9TREE|nr:uncharacterized protein I206_01738 [Kwoniella pini CBS 10737]OCF52448.1 hypothetical protein I206_01738 [Kwoniella pini CBS 10737]
MFSMATPALIALLPLAKAHMSIWTESMYGFSQSYDPVTPLSGKSFDQWWFHGNANDEPSAVTTLIPGKDLTLEIAYSGAYHSGGQTGSQSGWTGNSESNLLGCALAFSFKSSKASEIKMEDFTIMSIQEKCVRKRLTTFEIPSNLPNCPENGCTCAWFWQGKNSANEMYMTGFKCDVSGGIGSNYPTPNPPRKGKISGPTQPLYWANEPTNLDYTPDWETKPSYNSAWGWTPGAQTAAFGTSGSGSTNSSSGSGVDSSSSGNGATSTAGPGSQSEDNYSPSTKATSSPTSYSSPPSSSTSAYGGKTSTKTRGRRPQATETQPSYDDEEQDNGDEDQNDVPPWQELAADSEGVDGAGEQALVEHKVKNCKRKRHHRRNKLRMAHNS